MSRKNWYPETMKPEKCLWHQTRSFMVCFSLFLTVSTNAQQASNQELVTLPDRLDLARLVDLAASEAGFAVVYDQSQLRGEVTLRGVTQVPSTELFSLVSSVLSSRGFVFVEMTDGGLTVVRVSDAERASRGPGFLTQPSPLGGLFGSMIIEARNLSTKSLIESIQPLLSTGLGKAEPVPGTSFVVVSDDGARLAEIGVLLDRIDGSGAVVSATRYLPKSRRAEALSELATSVAESVSSLGSKPFAGKLLAKNNELFIIASADETPRWMRLLESLDTLPPVRTLSYSPTTFGATEIAKLLEQSTLDLESDSRRKILVNDLTGSLLVTGTDEDHTAVQRVLAELASVPEASRRPARQYVLKNRDVDDVLPLLEQLLALPGTEVLDENIESAATPTSAQSREPISTARDASNAQPDIKPPTLVSDQASNSLIAVATPAEHARLESLIERLDVRQAQVMIEVLMVSLSDDQSLDLGVEIDRLIDGPDNSIGRLSSLFGLGADAASLAVGAGGAGLTGVVLTPGEFSVVVRALEAINNGRSVSAPRVLVENNSPATIDAVLEAPFLSTNASDTVATTSFGGSESAGTQVTVTPQIAAGGHVRLEYSVSLSTFVGESASASLPPPRQQTSISSTATIPDGYTVAVGGIEVNTDGDAETRVPVLGSIPLIGELFKNRSRSNSKSKFYVFIRAEVLRSPTFADLRFLSDQQANEAEIDDGWPEVAPRLIR